MRGLPRGWVWTTLGECFRWRSGGTPRRTTTEYYNGGIPWAVIGDLNDGLVTGTQASISEEGLSKSSAKWAAPGSVLLAMYGSIGKLGIAGTALTTNQAIAHTHPRPLPARYLFWYLRSVRSELMGLGKGGTQKNISQTVIKTISFPLAPLPEQHRIVAKIESLFAKLEEGTAALRRTAANLERYRASVLKAAVEGRLTEQWRRENPPEETAEVLLRRVEVPPRPGRYRSRFRGVIRGHAALSVGATHSRLPHAWSWAPLADVARLESGHTPSRRRPEWWGGDVPWVGLKDARAHHGGAIFETLQSTNEDGLANSAARLLPRNTVCLSRTASVGYVVVLARPMATSQDFVNWICTEALEPKWLQIVLLADPAAVRRFGKGSTHTTVYFPEVLSLHVAVPPLAEQCAIVAEVDARLSQAADQEAIIRGALHRSSILRQSILKRAFEGRLVSKDPADEPASVLLERIRAERHAERRRRKRRPGNRRRQPKSRVS